MDNETIDFEQVVAKGCGLDVHKEIVVATVSGTGIKWETRTFFNIYALFERIEKNGFYPKVLPM